MAALCRQARFSGSAPGEGQAKGPPAKPAQRRGSAVEPSCGAVAGGAGRTEQLCAQQPQAQQRVPGRARPREVPLHPHGHAGTNCQKGSGINTTCNGLAGLSYTAD